VTSLRKGKQALDSEEKYPKDLKCSTGLENKIQLGLSKETLSRQLQRQESLQQGGLLKTPKTKIGSSVKRYYTTKGRQRTNIRDESWFNSPYHVREIVVKYSLKS